MVVYGSSSVDLQAYCFFSYIIFLFRFPVIIVQPDSMQAVYLDYIIHVMQYWSLFVVEKFSYLVGHLWNIEPGCGKRCLAWTCIGLMFTISCSLVLMVTLLSHTNLLILIRWIVPNKTWHVILIVILILYLLRYVVNCIIYLFFLYLFCCVLSSYCNCCDYSWDLEEQWACCREE